MQNIYIPFNSQIVMVGKEGNDQTIIYGCTIYDKKRDMIYYLGTTSVNTSALTKNKIRVYGPRGAAKGQLFEIPGDFIRERGHPIGEDLTIVVSQEIAKLALNNKKSRETN